MPIVSVTSDPEALTLTAIGEYPVPVSRLWKAYADPRQLERFWGPPAWPATFTEHDLRPGGRAAYHMTGPNGEISHGWWAFDEVVPEKRIVVRDGFADEQGRPNEAMPSMRMHFSFEPTATGSRFVSVTHFPDVEAMEKLVAMGMVEGMQEAMAQLDDVLADLREHAASLPAAVELVDDTHARVVRTVRGSMAQVWRAHHEPALLGQWMLGPDGWTMPVCEVAREVGDSYRYEWAEEQGEGRFGFVGELLESEPPRRSVTTERMIGVEGPGTVNELVLSPEPGGRTRIEVTITYPSRELRDTILATGMVDGMEASYARLERVLAEPTPPEPELSATA